MHFLVEFDQIDAAGVYQTRVFVDAIDDIEDMGWRAELAGQDAIDALCRRWAESRDVGLAEILCESGYVAREPVDVHVLTALLTGSTTTLHTDKREIVTALETASRDENEEIAMAAQSVLAGRSDSTASEGICNAQELLQSAGPADAVQPDTLTAKTEEPPLSPAIHFNKRPVAYEDRAVLGAGVANVELSRQQNDKEQSGSIESEESSDQEYRLAQEPEHGTPVSDSIMLPALGSGKHVASPRIRDRSGESDDGEDAVTIIIRMVVVLLLPVFTVGVFGFVGFCLAHVLAPTSGGAQQISLANVRGLMFGYLMVPAFVAFLGAIIWMLLVAFHEGVVHGLLMVAVPGYGWYYVASRYESRGMHRPFYLVLISLAIASIAAALSPAHDSLWNSLWRAL